MHTTIMLRSCMLYRYSLWYVDSYTIASSDGTAPMARVRPHHKRLPWTHERRREHSASAQSTTASCELAVVPCTSRHSKTALITRTAALVPYATHVDAASMPARAVACRGRREDDDVGRGRDGLRCCGDGLVLQSRPSSADQPKSRPCSSTATTTAACTTATTAMSAKVTTTTKERTILGK